MGIQYRALGLAIATALALSLPAIFAGNAISKPTCGARPTLSLSTYQVYWDSYSDYTSRQLSIDYRVENDSLSDAIDLMVIKSTTSGGVTLAASLPLLVGDVVSSSSMTFTLKHNVPVGVSRYITRLEATAQDGCEISYDYPGSVVSEFGNSDFWTTYDLGASESLGVKSFHNAVFDGRYIYCVPGWAGDGMHGKVARYDTMAGFTGLDSWKIYDFEIPLFANTSGPIGAVFDGRYIYFAPNLDDSYIHNGRVMRYDTAADFLDQDSWRMYDAGQTDGLLTRGYVGAVSDGRYVYFSPNENIHGPHANVLRYDSSRKFTEPESWAAYDARGTGSLDTRGYGAPVFDGRYVYFSPNNNRAPGAHGNVLRYDTVADFRAAGSWSAYDAGETGGLNTKGCGGFGNSLFDGRFIYLGSCGYTGIFLRFDTQTDFFSPDSWTSYDAGDSGGLLSTEGYRSAAAFDGRYIYYAPYGSYSSHQGKVLRFDTVTNFTSPASWSAFDATSLSPDAKGYNGAVFDGRFVYFIPDDNVDGGVGPHGLFLRYDTLGPFTSMPVETGSRN